MSSLRVLITNLAVSHPSGTETYVRDLAAGLTRLGHRPIVYSTVLGALAEEIAAAGTAVVDDLARLRQPPDVIHGNPSSGDDDGAPALPRRARAVLLSRSGGVARHAAPVPPAAALRGRRRHLRRALRPDAGPGSRPRARAAARGRSRPVPPPPAAARRSPPGAGVQSPGQRGDTPAGRPPGLLALRDRARRRRGRRRGQCGAARAACWATTTSSSPRRAAPRSRSPSAPPWCCATPTGPARWSGWTTGSGCAVSTSAAGRCLVPSARRRWRRRSPLRRRRGRRGRPPLSRRGRPGPRRWPTWWPSIAR